MISHIAIQLFTFDQMPRSLGLLQLLDGFVGDAGSLNLAWVDHTGRRKTASVRKLVQGAMKPTLESDDQNVCFKINEGYISVSIVSIRNELRSIGVEDVTIHLSVSPTSIVWASASESISSGVPTVRRVLSYVQSLERAAKLRGINIMPTVLEITLKCNPARPFTFADEIFNFFKIALFQSVIIDYYGTIDIGGEQLFFPKSGYNPSISDIHAYFSPEARSAWKSWRELHDAYLESPWPHTNSQSFVVRRR